MAKIDMRSLYEKMAEELDISPSKYKEAVSRYQAVGDYLITGIYQVAGTPLIYPQGSFRLGTIVRPVSRGEERDYDVDIVCEFPIKKTMTDPDHIKSIVGDRIKEHGIYSKMLDDEGRRCWTINYAESDGIGFHIDILPSTAEDSEKIQEYISKGVTKNIAEKAIGITNKDGKSYEWLGSNPNGYADWFWSNQDFAFQRSSLVQKRRIYSQNLSLFLSEKDVPDLLVRTPLQRAIQLLKRHRDLWFSSRKNEIHKPVSVIITTLATMLYDNEETTFDALKNIISKIIKYTNLLYGQSLDSSNQLIQKNVDQEWVIKNPVCPDENFADKWHLDNNARAVAFFSWIEQLVQDINQLETVDFSEAEVVLNRIFGKDLISKVYTDDIKISTIAPAIIIKPSKPWRKS